MAQARLEPARELLDESTASQLLAFSADPGRGLDPLLEKIVELVVETSGCDLGAAVFLVDDPLDKAHCHLRDVRRGLSVNDPERAETWRREQQVGARSESPATPLDLDVSEGLRLFEASRSAVRIYLLSDDGDDAMIQVESSETEAFGDIHAAALNGVARVAELVLRRFLLRSHAAHQGLRLHVVGGSPALLELEDQLRIIGRGARSSVLITGERGAGKELAAFAIHHFSPRRRGPFVALNSAALTETLFSDELFGHERGAYTGASEQRRGALLAADGGTLFLDEIGDMAPSIQASLLRFLENGELRRIGSDRSRTVDVRVVAATNRDLGQLVREGKFRADILDRLNVFRVHVPPLRERKADIELLTSFFMKTACVESGRQERLADSSICRACTEATGAACVCNSLYRTLGEHPFPGNVRELRNVVYRLAALVSDDEIQGSHARRHLEPDVHAATAAPADEDPTLDATIRRHIEKTLDEQGYNKSAAARVLGIPLTTLINKMKRLGIS